MYLVSGWTIMVCMVLIVLVNTYKLAPVPSPVFWLETLAIYAFAVSWFTKGRALRALRALFGPSSEPGPR